VTNSALEMSSGKASSALMRKRVASIIEASQDDTEQTVQSVTLKLLARHNEYTRYAKVRQILAFLQSFSAIRPHAGTATAIHRGLHS